MLMNGERKCDTHLWSPALKDGVSSWPFLLCKYVQLSLTVPRRRVVDNQGYPQGRIEVTRDVISNQGRDKL